MNLSKLLNKELETYNAQIYYFEFKKREALTILVDNKYYIGINKSVPEDKKLWLIEHELEHIRNKTFYSSSSSEYTVNQMEKITNDTMVLKNGLVSSILSLKDKGLNKEDICNQLEIPAEVYDHVIKLINRKMLSLIGENIKDVK